MLGSRTAVGSPLLLRSSLWVVSALCSSKCDAVGGRRSAGLLLTPFAALGLQSGKAAGPSGRRGEVLLLLRACGVPREDGKGPNRQLGAETRPVNLTAPPVLEAQG